MKFLKFLPFADQRDQIRFFLKPNLVVRKIFFHDFIFLYAAGGFKSVNFLRFGSEEKK